jgi:DNA topoisomerase IB
MPGVSALVRSDPGAAGISRRRCGRGFRYMGPGGAAVRDPGTITRIRSLVIPPAWQDVWICTDPVGHIQATGTDAAGRRQYRYHDLWREQRDQEKHDRMLEFGAIREELDGVRFRLLRGARGTGFADPGQLTAMIWSRSACRLDSES